MPFREQPASHEMLTSWGNVERIIRNTGEFFSGRDDIKNFVEVPLLKACEMFFDKNIRTVFSTANREDINGRGAIISIDFDSLSQENKIIAQELGLVHKAGRNGQDEVHMQRSLTPTTTVPEIESWALGIAGRFKVQEPVWVRRYTESEVRAGQACPIEEVPTAEDLAKITGMYLNPLDGLWYLNKELADKVNGFAGSAMP